MDQVGIGPTTNSLQKSSATSASSPRWNKAEGEGFEPPRLSHPTVFKTACRTDGRPSVPIITLIGKRAVTARCRRFSAGRSGSWTRTNMTDFRGLHPCRLDDPGSNYSITVVSVGLEPTCARIKSPPFILLNYETRPRTAQPPLGLFVIRGVRPVRPAMTLASQPSTLWSSGSTCSNHGGFSTCVKVITIFSCLSSDDGLYQLSTPTVPQSA